MISKSTIGVCAGVAGALFVGYCIYFDKKRRNDPDFKKRLREKRRKGRKGASSANVKWPDFTNREAVQKFFLSEVQLGEELLHIGEEEAGVTHLSRAAAVCGHPEHLLQVLQQNLPPRAFQMLQAQLPTAIKSFMEAAGVSAEGPKITEDDLE